MAAGSLLDFDWTAAILLLWLLASLALSFYLRPDLH
jgi:hypothetical protein